MFGRDLKTMTHVPYVFSRVFSHSHCYYCYPLRTSVFFCVWEFLLAKTIFAKWLLSCKFQPNQNCIKFIYLIKPNKTLFARKWLRIFWSCWWLWTADLLEIGPTVSIVLHLFESSVSEIWAYVIHQILWRVFILIINLSFPCHFFQFSINI